MELTPLFYPPDLPAWRAWLAENGASQARVWLKYFRKGSLMPALSYQETLDEALCFGWIDSLIQRIDDESYARLFTPRRSASKWSADNRVRIKALIAEGRVTPAGLAVLPPDLEAEPVFRAHPEAQPLPDFIQDALAANPVARQRFFDLPPSARRLYLNYILDAKRGETRQKRLNYILEQLALGNTINLLQPKK